MRKTQIKFSEIVEGSVDTILVIQDGRLKFVNTKCAQVLGYDKEEILDTPFVELIFPEDRTVVAGILIRQLEENLSIIKSFRVLKKTASRSGLRTIARGRFGRKDLLC